MKTPHSTVGRSSTTQRIEARSIAIHDDPHSLPVEPIDRTIYKKTDEEKAELATLAKQFIDTSSYNDQYSGREVHNITSKNKPAKITTRIATKRAKRLVA